MKKDKLITIIVFVLAIVLLATGIILLLANNRKYTVTFLNEGVEYYKEEDKKNYLIVTPTTPTKEGMQFAGWALNGRVVNFQSYKVTKDITLDAVWGEGDDQEGTDFAVTFATGDLNYPVETQYVKANHVAMEPDLSSLTYIEVLGWFYEDGTKYDFSTPVTSNISLFVHYMEDGEEIIAYHSEGIPEEENGLSGPGAPEEDVLPTPTPSPTPTPTPDTTPTPELEVTPTPEVTPVQGLQ